MDLSAAFYKDLIPYTSSASVTEDFVHKVATKLVKFLEESSDRNTKLIEFQTPEELKEKLDFSLPENSESLDQLLTSVDGILKYVVKTGHPRYFNQLWAGIDMTCLMGEWITAATNTNVFTYEIAPVYLIMENSVIEKLLSYIGFQDGDGILFPGYIGFENGDGILFPGGSLSNIQAMNLARYRFCPDLKQKGVFGCKKLVTFTSEESHYSIVKAAALLGLGTDNVIKVKTDKTGKMIPDDLEDKIKKSLEQGEQPFFVNATGGTTVGGVYDPLHAIADICEKYKLWMHIDAAWGGSCLISKKYRHFMDGCNRADSITWNPHKLMNCLLQCSALLTKEKGILKAANGTGAKYLFQQDKKLYDVSWDIGDKTFQCGRHLDVLKLWLMWKAKGTNGVEEQIDLAFSNSRHLAEEIKKRDNFILLREPECTNICFRYIPPGVAAMHDGPEKIERLYKIATINNQAGKAPPEIKKRMTLAGTMLIGYQPLKEEGNFFRMITVSPAVTTQDMDFVLDEIERLGKDL